MRNFALVCMASLGLASPVLAQVAATPDGCTPLMTVHKTQCTVATIFQCAEGYQTDGYVDGKLNDTHYYTDDWALTAYELRSDQARIDMLPNAKSVMSLKALIADGVVTEDRQISFNTRVIRDRIYDWKAETRLTGETAELGGKTFQRALSGRKGYLKGNEALAFEYDLLVSAELGVIIEGSYRRATFGTPADPVEQTPISLAFAGEPGFLTTRSDHGCAE